ncbi:MAG: hypothetical protein Q8907_12475 [Bacteroidota bacterium]|nr:hypothetical protein [Bacteroidota bacterium]
MSIAAFSLANSITGCKNGVTKEKIVWKELATLPPLTGDSVQPGLSGVFSGIIGQNLIIAGGTNFKNCMPWKGGAKTFYADIYACSFVSAKKEWKIYRNKFIKPLAYGVSISLPEGILCIGGSDSIKAYSEVFLMKYNGSAFQYEKWPSLPVPLANMCGAYLSGKIYIAGGIENPSSPKATRHFFVLDVNDKKNGWKTLASWPGEPRAFAVAVAQNNGKDNCFYLFSGRNISPDFPLKVLSDGYEYNPRLKQWKKLDGATGPKFPVMAATAVPFGSTHILFFGGVSKELALEEYNLKQKISQYPVFKNQPDNPDSVKYFKEKLLNFYENHPGFSKDVVLYQTSKNTISKLKQAPFILPVTTNVIIKDNSFIITCGEVKPGIRTSKIFSASGKN